MALPLPRKQLIIMKSDIRCGVSENHLAEHEPTPRGRLGTSTCGLVFGAELAVSAMTHRRIFVLGGSLFFLACGGEESQTQGSWPSVGTAKAELAEVGVASDSTHPLQTLTGKFLLFVIEGLGPEAGTKHYLAPDTGGAPVKLQFASPPQWRAGVQMKVRGLLQSGVFEVFDYEVPAAEELVLQAPLKSRSIGFIAIDVNGGGVKYDSGANPQSFMFSTTNPGPNCGLGANKKSVVQFYSETSYDRFEFTGGVEGPIAYPGNICGSSVSNWYANTQSLAEKISTKYDHYIYYNGTVQSVCTYGQGSLGTVDRPQGEIWFNGDLFDGAIPHELGHNLGLQHASSLKCSGVPLADDPLTCTSEEYGSPVDIMGNLFVGHMIVSEKWYLGWLSGCNGVRVKASGTFNLLPLENSCNGGIQALQIPMPKTTRKFSTPQSGNSNAAKFYYLEYRAGTGLDTGLPKQVAVHVSDEIAGPSRSAARSVSLDMKPSTTAKDGMVAGDSYTDPAGGVTFKVESMDATKAVVTVTLSNGSGSSTCIDGTTLEGSGPASCSATGTGGGTGTGGAGGMTGSGGKGGGGGMTSGGAAAGGASGGTATIGGRGGTAGASTGTGGAASGAGGTTAQGGTAGTSGAGMSGGTAGSSSAGSGTGGTTTGAGGTAAQGGATGASGASTTGGIVTTTGGTPATTGGVPAMTGGTVATSGQPSTAGNSNPGGAAPPPGDDSGCGCSVPGSKSMTAPSLLFAAAAAAVGRARRRRRNL
jgi:hypothetical protein